MYLIGEILNKFTKDSIAYCTNGVLEGTFIMCDQNNENRLFKLRPNGDCENDFYFGVNDKPLEDNKQWVFLDEIKDKLILFEIYAKLSKAIKKGIEKGIEFELDKN